MVLVLSSAAAALIPVSDEPDPGSSSTPSTDTAPSGELVKRTLRVTAAESQEPRTIRLRLGDQLVLRVTSKVADQVEISGLGELDDVGRDSPASFDLLPPEPGTYAVRLVDAEHIVGRIVVRGRGAGQDAGSPADSPNESPTASPGDSTAGFTPGALRAI